MTRLKYPAPPSGTTVDVLHGERVADPYRELEQADLPATRAWVDEQNRICQAFINQAPERGALRQRLGELANYPRLSAPWRRGGRWFLMQNSGLENQDRLIWRDRLNGPDHELLDPAKLSAEGTAALIGMAVSVDGKHLAYMVSRAGSDWAEIHVRAIETGVDLVDHVKWAKFSSLSWRADGAGFYYSRFAAPLAGAELSGVNKFQKLYFHALGTTQDHDQLVYERADDGEVSTHGEVTDDGRYLILSGWRGTSPLRTVHVIDLNAPGGGARPLVGEFIAAFDFVGNDGPRLFFRTTLNADRGRLVALDATQGLSSLAEILPESAATLEHVDFLNGHFVARFLEHAASALRIFTVHGKLVKDVELPGIGCVSSPKPHADDKELYFGFENLTAPLTVFALPVPGGAPSCFYRPPTTFDPDRFATSRVFYASKDGTQIPLFLAHRKDLQLDGTNPTILYGYGGFSISVVPSFRANRIAWLERGGVFAVACLRGGGEYGEAWHRSGIRERKQTGFDDFQAAASWLAKEKYTRSSRLAIYGGSNGGLLCGACLTQRPGLFAAVVAAVGVFDMLRFHKFTIGWAWTSDYGSPDDPQDFAVLRRYSPLHNLRPGTAYPATLLTTGDHDDRVVPAHSYKFAAALQAAQGGNNPILLRVDTDAGHGLGKPTDKALDEMADIYAFLGRVLA